MPPGRLEFERLDEGDVVGWSAEPDGTAAGLVVLQGERALVVAVTRTERADVCAALGVPPGALHGFRIELSPQVWAQRQSAGPIAPLVLRAAGVEKAVPLEGALERWAQELAALPATFQREVKLRRFLVHLGSAGGLKALGPAAAPWIEQQAELRGWRRALQDAEWSPPMPAEVRGGVEALDGLVVRGWAWVPGAASEHIRLTVNGVEVDAAVVRTQRPDAQGATGAPRSSLGFEIELPGRIWAPATTEERFSLAVEVAHQRLASPAMVLDRAALRAEWSRLCAREAELATAAGVHIDTHEHQYRLLLALEHLAASGEVDQLDMQGRVAALRFAQRFGLKTLFSAASAGPTATAGATVGASAGASASVSGPAQDPSTLAAWRALSEFNQACLRADSEPEALLTGLLEGRGLHGEARQRFLFSVLPYFCGLGSYALLRPHLDTLALRRLAASKDVWALSLALPELVAQGDYPSGVVVAKALAGDLPGWLNTECVAEAVRELCRQHEHKAALDPTARALVEALMNLLSSVGRDPWGRSHDRHLVRALVELLGLRPRLPDRLAASVDALAVRVHGLQPSFWLALERAQPLASAWPPRLRAARRVFGRLQDLLARPEAMTSADFSALVPELLGLFKAGNADAAQCVRESLLKWVACSGFGSPEAFEAALGVLDAIQAAEPLRLAAHPLLAAHTLSEAWDARQRIRLATGVPAWREAERGSALLRQIDSADGPHLPSALACHALAGAQHGHLGVVLASLSWARDVPRQAEAERRSGLLAVHEIWAEAKATAAGAAAPCAAALASAYGIVRRSSESLPWAWGVLSRWEAAMDGASSLLPYAEGAALQLRAPGPLAHTLVAIYSCRRNLDTRVRTIRETWARDLTERGVPWVIVVGAGAAASGAAALAETATLGSDQVLSLPVSDAYEDLPAKTLALIAWVHAHTDFDHLLKIDDDCHLAVDAFLESAPQLTAHYLGRRLQRAEGGTDRCWHQAKSLSPRGAQSIDKSPEPSIYADGGAGYALSRWAMGTLLAQLQTTVGSRMTRSAFMEDKLVGDLLRLGGIPLSSTGYETLVRRRTHAGAAPVNAYQNSFFPSLNSPTLVSHLDDAADIPRVQAISRSAALAPARVWPTCATPVLGSVAGTNQLELLSSAEGLKALAAAPVIVVAVARNEMTLLPHFLHHYRQLGVKHFVLVDNLSDDGTRDHLLAQPDVVLYSADTEYRHSHFGVAWQQAVLGNHALGKWVVLADIDEFLIYPACETLPMADWLASVEAQQADAVLTLMVDMYPEGELAQADFAQRPPFAAAPCFDRAPLIEWRLGSGCYSNGPTYLSALRHRLIPDSAPNFFTSQKLAVFKYQPWVRLSEGLHYASNLRVATEPVAFAHFKYHAGFQQKVLAEVARQQHFNGAEEYRKYLALVAESARPLFDAAHSTRWTSSTEFLAALPPIRVAAAGGPDGRG